MLYINQGQKFSKALGEILLRFEVSSLRNGICWWSSVSHQGDSLLD
jgi:hypothetical protein